jgi:uncharacterized RDD family membrane protein YckC
MKQIAGDSDTPVHALFSPEGVQLDIPIAGPGSRILAYAIDLATIITLLALIFFVAIASSSLMSQVARGIGEGFQEAMRHARIKQPTPDSMGGVVGLVFAICLLAAWVIETGYFVFWEMVTNGQSIGKTLIGLRVVRRNGLPIDLRSSLIRNLMRIVDILPSSYVVGLTSMLLSASGERLGDHAAGTIVIRLDRPEAAPEIETSAAEARLVLSRQQVAQIGARELQLIRATIRRVPTLPRDTGTSLLSDVARTIRSRLAMPESPGIDDLTFLRDILSLTERYSQSKPV